MARNLTSLPFCRMAEKDCAARNAGGKCEALERAYFRGRSCPFYKPEEQQRAENQACIERLLIIGRVDLLEKYHPDEYREFQKHGR